MLRSNFRLFIIFLAIVLFAIILKNGRIFDLGIIFRKTLVPSGVGHKLLAPPADIEQAYQKLLADNSSLQTLVKENQELKDLLNFRQEKNRQLVLGQIVNRDAVNPNIVHLNIGKNQGLENGQAVLVGQGIIVGKVIEVGTDFSQVRLLTDKFSKLAVSVGQTQAISGLLSGALGLSMNLSYIPQEEEVKKGDLVVTALSEDQVPAGLVVGQVENVDFSEEELFKQAAVSPLVDYNSISLVAVIIAQ